MPLGCHLGPEGRPWHGRQLAGRAQSQSPPTEGSSQAPLLGSRWTQVVYGGGCSAWKPASPKLYFTWCLCAGVHTHGQHRLLVKGCKLQGHN